MHGAEDYPAWEKVVDEEAEDLSQLQSSLALDFWFVYVLASLRSISNISELLVTLFPGVVNLIVEAFMGYGGMKNIAALLCNEEESNEVE